MATDEDWEDGAAGGSGDLAGAGVEKTGPADLAGAGVEKTGPADLAGAGGDEALDALMDPEPSGPSPMERRSRGSAPLAPTADTEKTLGLEIGRLFGLNPRLLVNPDPTPTRPRRPEGAETGTADLSTAEPGTADAGTAETGDGGSGDRTAEAGTADAGTAETGDGGSGDRTAG